MLASNIKKFADTLKDLNFEVDGWDEENEKESDDEYVTGYKVYNLEYEIGDDAISIKSNPSRLADQLINDITAIETLFKKEDEDE